MSNTCPKCGVKVSVVGGWLGPIMSHEPNDATCLRNQNAQLREQLAKVEEVRDDLQNLLIATTNRLERMEAEAKRYREAWGRLRAYQVKTVDSMESNANEVVRFIAAPRHRTTLKKMDDLIAPAEQGTTHD